MSSKSCGCAPWWAHWIIGFFVIAFCLTTAIALVTEFRRAIQADVKQTIDEIVDERLGTKKKGM